MLNPLPGRSKKLIKDSFDELLEEVRRCASDESEVERLLTERVVKAFVLRLAEDSKNEAKLRREEEEEEEKSLKKKEEGHEHGVASFNASNIRKGKISKRKRAAKVPDSVIQFVRSLAEPAEDKASSSSYREEEEEEEKLRRPKKRKMKMHQPLEFDPDPEIPEEFKTIINNMNGINTVLVMQKQLTETDLAKQNNRLSIPRKQIMNEFLNEEEKTMLDEKRGLEVNLIQPCLGRTRLVLKKWSMNNTYCYNLIDGWCKKVVDNKANGLESGSMIQLWAFRQDSKLCFLLIKVRDEEEDLNSV